MTKFTFNYLGYNYFFDLLALMVLLAPAYQIAPGPQTRRILMILAGIYLDYFIAPRLLILMFPCWCAIFFLQRALAWKERTGSVGVLSRFLALTIAIVPMVMWKIYGDDLNIWFNWITDSWIQRLSFRAWQIDVTFPLIIPVGLSFATFRALDLLIKTSIGTLPSLGFDQVMFYGFFPPVQVVGPIIEYQEISRQDAKIKPEDVLSGCLRIAVGAVKIFFITEALKSTTRIFETPHDFRVWDLWIKFSLYTFYFYIDFSGYTDMAIGTARVFGFRIRENFNFPFFKRNIQEFWNSWHMSLSSWAQRNVYVPAGGYRPRTQYLALFLTIMAIALWHGISLPIAGFGVYHFSLLSIHRLYKKFARQKHLPETPQIVNFYTALTYFSVMISFPLITTTWDKAGPFYHALLGM